MNITLELTRTIRRSRIGTWVYNNTVCGIILVVLPFYLLMLSTFRVGTWTDDGFYVTLARSLARGTGMRLIHLPGQPMTAIVPPGYPLILSPMAMLFPKQIIPLQLVSLVFVVATIYVLHHYVRSKTLTVTAIAVTALFALNPQVVSASSWIMSEATFIFFVWLSLLLAERLVANSEPTAQQVIFAVLATAMMPLTRYFGLPLMVASIGYVLFSRRDRQGKYFAAGVIIVVLGISLAFGAKPLWERYARVGSRFLEYIGVENINLIDQQQSSTASLSFWAGFAKNTRHLVLHALPSAIIPLFDGPRVRSFFRALGLGFVPPMIQLIISGIVLLGFIRSSFRRVSGLDVYTVCYLGFLLIITRGKWPDSGSASRYFFPMIGFTLFYFLETLSWISKQFRRWWPDAFEISSGAAGTVFISIVGALILLYLSRDVQAVVTPVRDRIPNISLGATWIAENTESDDVVMTETPRVRSIYADRTFVPYPNGGYEPRKLYPDLKMGYSVSKEVIKDIIEKYKVDYVMVDYAISSDLPFHWSPYTKDHILPLLEESSDQFSKVFTSNDGFVRVYRVHQ